MTVRNSNLAQFVLSNLGWMAASIFLALVVWVAATMTNNPIEQREINRIPVIVTLPEGYILDRPSASPLTAQVVVRAQKSEWDLLVPDDIVVTADLSQISRPGEYRVELRADVMSPRHGRVVAIRPSSLTLIADQEAEKRVPVQPFVSQDPPLGYTVVSEPTCDQTEATVRGTSERVNSVHHAEVRIDLSDEQNPITRTFDLIPVQENNRSVSGVELVPAQVTCSVTIEARDDVVEMRVLPNVIGNPPDGYLFGGYADVTPETVGVTGNRLSIGAMGGVVRTEAIDISTRTETFTVEVPLSLPPGVSLVPENQLIEVTVMISSLPSSRQLEEVPVEVTGLDSTQYRATVLQSAVTVFAVGPETLLPDRENLHVVVDLSGLTPGNHQVVPRAVILGQEEAPDQVTITIYPEELTVSIEPLTPTPLPSVTPTLDTTPLTTGTPSPRQVTSTPTP